jgi:myo-inositol-1(or 4)-monophosphatase
LLFSASLGGGSWLNGDRLQIKAPHKSGRFDLVAAKMVEDDMIWKPNSKPPFNREHKPSIAFRMASVSQGRYHAMMTLRDSWEWDICAGSLLISESGGVVVDKYLSEPVFNTKKRKTKGIIAGTKEIVELVGSSLNL